ncbi:hypothetical protein [Oceaniglobus roseus]|uniref:hypothetical protein n=1 Tax=Oceaniglobus roseus TaxID=1737570 RepID=UPI0013000940|nr:hypothetical protein [Kandeliimicrobium roseum]
MTDRTDLSRRRLLAGAPLASASLALGATGAAAETRPEEAAPEDKRQPRFATSDHVATFYRLARD